MGREKSKKETENKKKVKITASGKIHSTHVRPNSMEGKKLSAVWGGTFVRRGNGKNASGRG